MRLIDADAVKFRVEYGYDNHGVLLVPYRDIKKSMEATKTVDAVPVLRCKDCKYWGDGDGKLQGSDGVLFARCTVHNYLIDGRHTGWCPTENDFCSYGERRGGDEDG